MDCKAEGKEVAREGWRRVKATTKSHRTEVISDPPLLVICVPEQPLELTWIEEAYHQIVRYLDHVPYFNKGHNPKRSRSCTLYMDHRPRYPDPGPQN